MIEQCLGCGAVIGNEPGSHVTITHARGGEREHLVRVGPNFGGPVDDYYCGPVREVENVLDEVEREQVLIATLRLATGGGERLFPVGKTLVLEPHSLPIGTVENIYTNTVTANQARSGFTQRTKPTAMSIHQNAESVSFTLERFDVVGLRALRRAVEANEQIRVRIGPLLLFGGYPTELQTRAVNGCLTGLFSMNLTGSVRIGDPE